MASILEVGVEGQRFFNVFDAAPENDRDGPSQQITTERKVIIIRCSFILYIIYYELLIYYYYFYFLG